MTIKAKAVMTLYRIGKINIEGVRQAVIDKLITENEYFCITGQDY